MSLGFSTTTSVVNKRKRIYPECGREQQRVKRGNNLISLASPQITLVKKGRRKVGFSSAMNEGQRRFDKRSVRVHAKAWKLFRKAERTFEQAFQSPVHLHDVLLEKAIHYEELAKEKIRCFSSGEKYVPQFFVEKVESLIRSAAEKENEGLFETRDVLLKKAVEIDSVLRTIYCQE